MGEVVRTVSGNLQGLAKRLQFGSASFHVKVGYCAKVFSSSGRNLGVQADRWADIVHHKRISSPQYA